MIAKYDNNYFTAVPGLSNSSDQRWKFQQILPALKKSLQTNPGKTIKLLEIGAGTGQILKHILNEFSDINFEITVFEINKSAKSKIYHNTKAKFQLHDITKKSKYKNKYFDMCLCIDVLEHLENLDGGLTEIKRISKNAIFKIPIEKTIGIFLINILTLGHYRRKTVSKIGHIHWFTFGQIIRILNKHFYIKYLAPTNISLLQFNKYRRQPLSIRNIFLRTSYYISKTVYSLSPRLNALLFCDHIVVLVEC